MKRLFPIFLVLMIGAVSCRGPQMDEVLLESDDVLLKVNSTVVFSLAECDGQIGFCADRKTFRAGTDDMSEYFVLRCSELPSEEGQDLSAELRWTTATGIQQRIIKMKVQQIKGGTIWLWAAQDKIAVIVKELQ